MKQALRGGRHAQRTPPRQGRRGPAPRGRHAAPIPAWRSRDARLLLAARAVMMGVNSLVLVALQLRVHDSGAGPTATMALMVALAVPAVVTVGVTGVVADTHDSRVVVLTAMAVQVFAALMLALRLELVWTIAWAVVMETGFAFTGPVWSALVPRVAGDSGVQRLASAQMVASNVVSPIGAGLGGWLVQVEGGRLPMVVAAGLVVVAVAVAGAIRTRRGGRGDPLLAARSADEDKPAGEWRAGIRALRQDPVAWVVYLGLGPLALLGNGVAVLEVYLVRDQLHASPTLYGLTELFYGAGAVLGAIAVGRLQDDRARVLATIMGFGGAMLMVGAAGVAPSFLVYGAVILALGLTNAYGNGAVGPLFVLRVPEEVRGRVQAAVSATMNAALIIALPMGGVLGSIVGIRQTFLLCCAVGMLAVLLMATNLWRHRESV